MRIHSHRSQILEPSLLQIRAYPVRQPVSGRNLPLLVPHVQNHLPLGKPPEILRKRPELFPHLPKTSGIMYHCFHLPPGPDHPLRPQYPQNILLSVLRHLLIIEPVKAFPEYFSLLEHHIPVQPALHDFHHQVLKLLPVVPHRHAPLLVMILYHFLIAQTPSAPFHSQSPPIR